MLSWLAATSLGVRDALSIVWMCEKDRKESKSLLGGFFSMTVKGAANNAINPCIPYISKLSEESVRLRRGEKGSRLAFRISSSEILDLDLDLNRAQRSTRLTYRRPSPLPAL